MDRCNLVSQKASLEGDLLRRHTQQHVGFCPGSGHLWEQDVGKGLM